MKSNRKELLTRLFLIRTIVSDSLRRAIMAMILVHDYHIAQRKKNHCFGVWIIPCRKNIDTESLKKKLKAAIKDCYHGLYIGDTTGRQVPAKKVAYEIVEFAFSNDLVFWDLQQTSEGLVVIKPQRKQTRIPYGLCDVESVFFKKKKWTY
jgi:hypothetical protein